MVRQKKVCTTCGRDWDEVRLDKCVVCHKYYCHSCAVRRYGKFFCAKECAEIFFFGGDEDE